MTFLNEIYKPDVLSCIANLSSDEVFTPPEVANNVLDMLPQELFFNTNTKFLDPCCKSGVFLREIAKRLIEGLKDEIPDLEKRLEHIFKNQLYGIAITELTGLLSRRSVYCAKDTTSQYSVVDFKTSHGNIEFKRINHLWFNKKCIMCGASEGQYNRGDILETHAYQFIHMDAQRNKDEFKRLKEMKFDVIIGNPPYQLNVGVEQDNYAIPLYHKFIEQAKKLNPRYVTMIVPARWYAGGRNLDNFRDEMLNDKRIRKIVDYPNATDCFPGVDISGGICYFLWDRDNEGQCLVSSMKNNQLSSQLERSLLEKNCNTFIRFNEAISILRKIQSQKEKTFDTIVSPQTPYGLISSFKDYEKDIFPNAIKLHTVNGIGYIRKSQISKNLNLIKYHKIFIAKSYGERGSYPYLFLGKPFYGEPNSCCTQTYLSIGTFDNKEEASNAMSYMRTRFFRFCIMLKKNTQDAMRGVYAFVPIQDFSKEWTDEELYKKYNITTEEIEFIESMVRPVG